MVASSAFRPHPPQNAQLSRHQSALQRSPIMVLSRTLMGMYRPASQVKSCATVGVVSLDNATKKKKTCIFVELSPRVGREAAGCWPNEGLDPRSYHLGRTKEAAHWRTARSGPKSWARQGDQGFVLEQITEQIKVVGRCGPGVTLLWNSASLANLTTGLVNGTCNSITTPIPDVDNLALRPIGP